MLTHFVTKYAKYLEEKCSVYRLLGYQFEKNKTVCKNLKAAKVKVVHKLQSQFNALLNVKMRKPLVAKNMIMHRVLLLILRDAITLYSILNEGILSLMDEFWSMQKKDAQKVVEIYKLFLRETDALLRLFEVGKLYSSSLPVISKPDAGVVSSMQKYISRLDGHVSEDSSSNHSASLYDHSEEYEDDDAEPHQDSEEEAPPSSSSEEDVGDGGLAEFDNFLQDFVLRTLNMKNFNLQVDQNLLTTTIAPVKVGELQIPDMQFLMTGTKSGTPLTTKTNPTSSLNFSRASSIPSLSSSFTYQPSPTFTLPTQPGLQAPTFSTPAPTSNLFSASSLAYGAPPPAYSAPPMGSFTPSTNNPFASSSGASPLGASGGARPLSYSSNNPFATNPALAQPSAFGGAGMGTGVPLPTQQKPTAGPFTTNPFSSSSGVKSTNNPFASIGGGAPPAAPPTTFGSYGTPVIPLPQHPEHSSSSSEEPLPAPPGQFAAYGPPIIPVPGATVSSGGLPARQDGGLSGSANPFLKM